MLRTLKLSWLKMLFKRLLFIINPYSGGGEGAKILERYKREALEVDLKCTFISLAERQPDKSDLEGADLCVIAGGDGTLSQLINRFDGFSIPIFILALGTGNDLAKEYEIARALTALSLGELLKIIRQCEVKRHQCWRFLYQLSGCTDQSGSKISKELIFCNYLSGGLDGAIIASFDKARSTTQGSSEITRQKISTPKVYTGPNYSSLLNSTVKVLGRLFGRWGNRVSYAFISSRYLCPSILPALISTILRKLSLDKQVHRQLLTKESIQFSLTEPRSASAVFEQSLTLFFANIRSVSGLGISNTKSDPSDALLEALSITNPLQYLPFFSARIFKRLFGSYFIPGCYPNLIASRSEWHFTLAQNTLFQADGEPINGALIGTCSIVPGPVISIVASSLR